MNVLGARFNLTSQLIVYVSKECKMKQWRIHSIIRRLRLGAGFAATLDVEDMAGSPPRPGDVFVADDMMAGREAQVQVP